VVRVPRLDVAKRNVEWGIKVLKDMVSIPTVNPPGERYQDFARYSKEVLESVGFSVRVYEVPADYVRRYYPDYANYPRYVVYGSYGEGSPVVHFNGHYDVVPAGSGWSRSPFEPVVDGGRLYGRGSSDMKGGIAAFLAAAKSFIESGKFRGSIEVALVPDEEIGGESGTGYLVRELRARPDYVVIGEPSGSGVVWIGHKGAVWVTVGVHGRQAHGSTPWLGVNAFESMVKVAEGLMREYLPYLESRRSAYEYDDPRGARPTAMLGGEVRGGAKVNVVPGYYSFSIDRRVTPDEKLEDVEREVAEFVRRAASELPRDVKVEVKVVNRLPPALTDPNSRLVRVAKEAAKEVLGREPRATVCLGGLDMRYYTEVGVSTVTYGPGALGVAHIADEYLPLDDFERMVYIYYLMLEKLLT
jgi:succinyl-diaminopimelate desuccinylase